MKKIIIIIFFTFYAPNVYAINILKLGKFFNEVADEVVEIFAEIIYQIPGSRNFIAHSSMKWLFKYDEETYENYSHEKIFEEMWTLNKAIKSQDIKVVMNNLNLDYFENINTLTNKIPYDFKKDPNITVTETIDLLKGHKNFPKENILTLTCSGIDKVYNFVFSENKAILTLEKSFDQSSEVTFQSPIILGGIYTEGKYVDGSKYYNIYLSNLNEDTSSNNPDMRYLNQWYIFRLGHTKSGKKFFRFHFEKGIEMGQSPKVDMTEGSIYQKVKYPYCEN